VRGHDFRLYVREQFPYGANTLLHRICRRRHTRHGTRFRHAITNRQTRQIQRLMKFFHEVTRDRGSSRDSGAQLVEA